MIPSTNAVPAPSWVTDGWYSNNPYLQRLAVVHWYMPVTTSAEREQATADAAARASLVRQGDPLYELGFPCTDCGKFRFDKPTRCYWCR